jgi:hypothetical protein
MLGAHIDRKHGGDRLGYTVKFVDTDPNSDKTVKLEDNLGMNVYNLQ